MTFFGKWVTTQHQISSRSFCMFCMKCRKQHKMVKNRGYLNQDRKLNLMSFQTHTVFVLNGVLKIVNAAFFFSSSSQGQFTMPMIVKLQKNMNKVVQRICQTRNSHIIPLLEDQAVISIILWIYISICQSSYKNINYCNWTKKKLKLQ